MTLWTLIRRSLVYYWRTNLAVAAGVAVAVAVVVGSLVVGDSARGSLRHAALRRLGKIGFALRRDRFFREDLVAKERPSGGPAVAAGIEGTVPVILVRGAVRLADGRGTIPNVTVLGVDERFWPLFANAPAALAEGRDVAISRSLAEDLHAREGDALIVSLGRSTDVPVETIFGRTGREDALTKRRVTVRTVLAEEGAGAFSLKTDRVRPRNLFVSLRWLQRQLDEEGCVNMLLLAEGGPTVAADLQSALARSLTLDEYDLKLLPSRELHVLTLVATNVVLPNEVHAAASRAAGESSMAQSASTSVYLANRIAVAGRTPADEGVPYSIIGALDGGTLDVLASRLPARLGISREVAPSDNEIVLNEWAANDLRAKPGDPIEITYYRSGPRGQLLTEKRTFTLKGTIPADVCGLLRDAVPNFEGMTDADSLGEWDPPFRVDMSRIRPKDETYWDKWKTAPKAFVSNEALRAMWMPDEAALAEAGRWVTAVRLHLPAETTLDAAAETFTERLLEELRPARAGFVFQPVRAQALAASKGTQDFATLFLSMSFFLVAAAAGLIYLLMRLSVERRASQIGILLATGFDRRDAGRTVVREGFVVALVGMIVGAPLGVLYAHGILRALRTNWAGAVAEFPMQLHVTVTSVITGAFSGLLVAALAVLVSTRILRKMQGLVLLGGWRAVAAEPRTTARRPVAIIAVIAFAAAAVLLLLWGVFEIVPATAAFASSGFGLLVGSLALFCVVLLRPRKRRAERSRLSLGTLALRGASRHWVRSLLTVGLLACASLLIVTVSAFRKDLSRLDPTRRDSGAGGFQLVATSNVPIHRDLNTDAGRKALGFSDDASRALEDVTVMSFRRTAGDDISCLNLQKTPTPRVLGVPRELIDRGGFTFASSIEAEDPWQLLDRQEEEDDAVPCFADAATAQWQLKKGIGDIIDVPMPDGGTAKLKLVGTLPGSVFAGDLLIAEEQFIRHFGRDSGYRYFLVQTPENLPARVDVYLDKSAVESLHSQDLSAQGPILGALQARLGQSGTVDPVFVVNSDGRLCLWISLNRFFADSYEVGIRIATTFEKQLRVTAEARDYFDSLGAHVRIETSDRVTTALRANLGDMGVDMHHSLDILAKFAQVQNTYLSAFETLGGLGLLLGTFGVVTVLLRNVVERRGELAMLLALGFTRGRLVGVVLLENALLLLIGVVVGTFCALVAAGPQLASATSDVNWTSLASMLLLTAGVGVASCALASAASVRGELIAALRSE